jgi:hypothetical protein
MLSLLNSSGVDLVANPPAAVTVRAQLSTGADYTVTAVLIENAGTLPVSSVEAALWWNDGGSPDFFSYTTSSNGTLSISAHRVLSTGNHNLRLVGWNFRAPLSDEVACNFAVTVLPRTQPSVAPRQIYGPIMPKDDGSPNPQQWNFDTDSDVAILQSSVKMLLGTAKGERIMEPGYGTNLRRLLFEPMAQGLGDVARQEIADSISTWEPRVTLQNITVQQTSERSITVFCDFLSKLTQDSFTTRNTFEV